MHRIKFIEKFANNIIRASKGTYLFPSVMMGQTILETGFGKSTIGPAKNLYGIKATGKHTPYWKGDFFAADTLENFGGSYVTLNEKFRKYNTYTDSIRDYAHLLTTAPRYKKALSATTPEQQIQEIHKAGYATEPNYSSRIINLINQYNLKHIDKKKINMKTLDYIFFSLVICVALLGLYRALKI